MRGSSMCVPVSHTLGLLLVSGLLLSHLYRLLDLAVHVVTLIILCIFLALERATDWRGCTHRARACIEKKGVRGRLCTDTHRRAV